MTALVWLLGAVLLDDLRLRYLRRLRKQSDAAMVAAALGPRVEVDGIMLPAYDDDWKWDDGREVLTLGRIDVRDDGRIYVGRNTPYMERTPAVNAYCRAVWTAYRSRLVAQR